MEEGLLNFVKRKSRNETLSVVSFHKLFLVNLAAVICLHIYCNVCYADKKSGGRTPNALFYSKQESRSRFQNVEFLIEKLEIKSGMNILDIGAGTGYYSYLLAEKLEGTGNVFATDVSEHVIKFIKEEIKKRGLINLHPVLVKEKGVDEFYKRHKFHRIIFFHVYYYIGDRVNYLKNIRNSLMKNGKVAILINKKVFDFSIHEFKDFNGFIEELSKEPYDSPFIRYLSETTKTFLKQYLKGTEISQETQGEILKDLNRCLVIPDFYKNLMKTYYFGFEIDALARDFTNWLIMELNERAIIRDPKSKLTYEELRIIKKINRIIFMQRFSSYFKYSKGGDYAPFSIGDANKHVSKLLVIREFEQGGFKLENEFVILPYYDLLIFKEKDVL